MENKIKKLFHRKSRKSLASNSISPEQSRPVSTTSPASPVSPISPVLPLRYDAAPPGKLPRQGGAPLHGNGSAIDRKSIDRLSNDATPASRGRSSIPKALTPDLQALVGAQAAAGVRLHPRSRDVDGEASWSLPNAQSQTNQHYLQPVNTNGNFSNDMHHLTVGGDDRRAQVPACRHSEDVADWNIAESQRGLEQSNAPDNLRPNARNKYSSTSELDLEPPPRQECVANLGSSVDEYDKKVLAAPHLGSKPPSRYKEPPPVQYKPKNNLHKKADAVDLAAAKEEPTPGCKEIKASQRRSQMWEGIPRTSLDKSLPPTPDLGLGEGTTVRSGVSDGNCEPTAVDEAAVGASSNRNLAVHPADPDDASDRATEGFLLKNALQAPDLQNVVDLGNAEDTTVDQQWAPAVTHETVYPHVHHIREERITKEYHNHDIYHRILPIIDVEVLPARHYLPVTGGGLVEISEDEIPGRVDMSQAHNQRYRNWVIAETASKPLSSESGPKGLRQFTARKFEGEGDEKTYYTPEGFPRTETTWVHPPTVEEGAKLAGQTYPLYVDEVDHWRGPSCDLGEPEAGNVASSRKPRDSSHHARGGTDAYSGRTDDGNVLSPGFL